MYFCPHICVRWSVQFTLAAHSRKHLRFREFYCCLDVQLHKIANFLQLQQSFLTGSIKIFAFIFHWQRTKIQQDKNSSGLTDKKKMIAFSYWHKIVLPYSWPHASAQLTLWRPVHLLLSRCHTWVPSAVYKIGLIFRMLHCSINCHRV